MSVSQITRCLWLFVSPEIFARRLPMAAGPKPLFLWRLEVLSLDLRFEEREPLTARRHRDASASPIIATWGNRREMSNPEAETSALRSRTPRYTHGDISLRATSGLNSPWEEFLLKTL